MAATAQRSDIDAQIGQRVHHVLWRRKIQQRDLATALGITQSTLSRRLRGESAWFAGDLVAVARELDVSIGWLFGEDDVVRPKGLEPLTFWTLVKAFLAKPFILTEASARLAVGRMTGGTRTPNLLVPCRVQGRSWNCEKCGAPLDDNLTCPACGQPVRPDDLALTA